MRTQVGIVGAGPAGLMLARLLEREGIESVVLENRSREYVEHRIRAGVLEQGTADLLVEAGVGERMQREGIVHHGIELQFAGERHRIPLSDLTGGRSIVVYGQTEIVKDLVAARLDAGAPLLFEVEDVTLHDLETERPRIELTHDGAPLTVECDVVAGCDGFHGVSRPSIPDGVLRTFEREYAYAWLGILAAVAPSNDELVYAHHERGFALLSLRGPELSRLYVQCRPDEDIAEWPDDRIWEELQLRLGLDGWTLAEGADPGEGHHGHAQLRRRADAARPPLPRRRRGAHRPADRREGPEPRDRGRAPAGRGARRLLQGRGRGARRPTRSAASRASGGPSTSPGG